MPTISTPTTINANVTSFYPFCSLSKWVIPPPPSHKNEQNILLQHAHNFFGCLVFNSLHKVANDVDVEEFGDEEPQPPLQPRQRKGKRPVDTSSLEDEIISESNRLARSNQRERHGK